jgi:hypothetical protein
MGDACWPVVQGIWAQLLRSTGFLGYFLWLAAIAIADALLMLPVSVTSMPTLMRDNHPLAPVGSP